MMKKIKILTVLLLLTMLFFSGENLLGSAQAGEAELLKYLPEKPLLFGYVRGFGNLMKKYAASKLKKDNSGSAVFVRFEKSKLYMKMESRFKRLGEAFSIELNEAFVSSVADQDALLALYDFGELKFLMLSKMELNLFEKTKLNSMKETFERRKIDGREFYFVEDKKTGLELMFVWVDDTLLLGNDLPIFEESLKLYDDNRVKSAMTDISVQMLLKNSKLNVNSADAFVFLDLGLINRTPYFKNYFLFNDQKEYMNYDKELISAFFEDDGYVERRVILPIKGAEFNALQGGFITSFEETNDDFYTDYLTSSVFDTEVAGNAFLAENITKLFFSDFTATPPLRREEKRYKNSARGRADKVSREISDYLKSKGVKEGVTYFALDPGRDGFSVDVKRCVALRCSENIDSADIAILIQEYIGALFLKKVDVTVKYDNGVGYIKMPMFDGLSFAFYSEDEYFFLANDKEYLTKIKEKLDIRNTLDNNPSVVIKLDFKKAAADFKALSAIITGDYRAMDIDTRRFFSENVKSLLYSVDYIGRVKYIKKPYIDHLYEELRFTFDR